MILLFSVNRNKARLCGNNLNRQGYSHMPLPETETNKWCTVAENI